MLYKKERKLRDQKTIKKIQVIYMTRVKPKKDHYWKTHSYGFYSRHKHEEAWSETSQKNKRTLKAKGKKEDQGTEV